MRASYSKFCWLAVFVIAISSTGLALVSLRMKTKGAVLTSESEGEAKTAGLLGLPEDSRGKPTISGLSQPQVSQGQRLESELITIRPTGFEPTEIIRPKGPFVLAVENRSGLREVNFQLAFERGERVFQVSRSWEALDWYEVVDPPAGRYLLTEINHPGWTCTLTITR